MLQEQAERIRDIAEQAISGLKVSLYPPDGIDTRLPVLVPLETPLEYTKVSQTEYQITTRWELHLYLAQANSGTPSANHINLREYLDALSEAFISRDLLQYAASGNAVALPFVRNTSFRMTSGLSTLKTYPPRVGQERYWGATFELIVTTYSIIKRAV